MSRGLVAGMVVRLHDRGLAPPLPAYGHSVSDADLELVDSTPLDKVLLRRHNYGHPWHQLESDAPECLGSVQQPRRLSTAIASSHWFRDYAGIEYAGLPVEAKRPPGTLPARCRHRYTGRRPDTRHRHADRPSNGCSMTGISSA